LFPTDGVSREQSRKSAYNRLAGPFVENTSRFIDSYLLAPTARITPDTCCCS